MDQEYELTDKALELASMMAQTSGIQNMMSNPIMSSVMRKNPARENIQQQDIQTKDTSEKDPNYTTIRSTQRIIPLRVGDSEADIFVKMFNLFKSEHDYKIKKTAREDKFRRQFVEDTDRRLEEIIDALEGKAPKKGKTKRPGLNFLKYATLGAAGLASFFIGKKAFANIDMGSLFGGMDTSIGTGKIDALKAKEIYNYLTKEKGLSKQQALGMIANIQAESSFKPGALGDKDIFGRYTSGGLFQHHAERFESMKKFVGPNWENDWKKQIDFALQEQEGKLFTSKQYKTEAESAEAFTRVFEKPKNVEAQIPKRIANLPKIESAIQTDTDVVTVPEKKEPVPVTKEVPRKETMKTSSVGGTVIQNNVTNIKQADTTVAQNNQPKSNKPIIMVVQYGVA